MSKGPDTGVSGDPSAEQGVVDYLRDHPDFFTYHLDLLNTLQVPHPCGSAVSLIERQVLLLREQNAQLRKKLLDLVEVARYNDRLSERMQRLALGLMEANDLDELLRVVKEVLREEFNADFTALRLAAQPVEAKLASEEEFVGSDVLALFEPILKKERPQCGRLTETQARCLFGKTGVEVASAAMIPLRGPDWRGLLVIGSVDKGRFQPAMGTLFLSRMGALISHALRTYLSPCLDSARLL